MAFIDFVQGFRRQMETLTTIATLLATAAVLLVIAGLVFAKNRKKHVPLMMAAFICDMIGLVLVEFGPLIYGQSDAVTGLATAPGLLKSIHAALATASVVGYILQIISGKKILAGDRTRLDRHKTVARVFLLARLGAYITMFML